MRIGKLPDASGGRRNLVRQRTVLVNALRGHLSDFGISAAQGPGGIEILIEDFHAEQDDLPTPARPAMRRLIDQIKEVDEQIETAEKEIVAWCRTDAAARRLTTIPGIGPITASAISAAVPDPTLFRSGRRFAAWLGLTPKPRSSGSKERLGGISRQGDGSIRRLPVIGATSVIRRAREHGASRARIGKLLENKPARVVSVALANKTARIRVGRGEVHRAAPAARRDPARRRPAPAAGCKVPRCDDEPVDPGPRRARLARCASERERLIRDLSRGLHQGQR